MKIGVELEYWIVDEDGRLASTDELLDVSEHVTNEFVDALIEVQVPPVETIDDLRREIVAILRPLLAAARASGKHLVPLATPLTTHDLPIITERGRLLERIYGAELEYAKHCAGTHVHFDQTETIRQLNLLTALDPALALVNSAPYYDGKRIADSARASVYRLGAGSEFSRYRDLWIYADDVEEWNARSETEYKLLETISQEHGVDPDEFKAYFHPENAVLTPVRLRKRSPTVEWRAPDTTVPSQIVRLVADVVTLMEQIERKPVVIGEPGVFDDRIGVPTFAELRALSDRAISEGIDSPEVTSYLTTMGFDLANYRPIAGELRAPTVDEEDARAIRLAYAERLERDVSELETAAFERDRPFGDEATHRPA